MTDWYQQFKDEVEQSSGVEPEEPEEFQEREITVMDIGSGGRYPSNALSNFSPHPFTIDGVACASMEGFLQSLKFKNPDMQAEVCKLVGKKAKFKGKKKNWQQEQTLWWRGQPIPRDSADYQNLLDRAYEAMFDQSESFRKWPFFNIL